MAHIEVDGKVIDKKKLKSCNNGNDSLKLSPLTFSLPFFASRFTLPFFASHFALPFVSFGFRHRFTLPFFVFSFFNHHHILSQIFFSLLFFIWSTNGLPSTFFFSFFLLSFIFFFCLFLHSLLFLFSFNIIIIFFLAISMLSFSTLNFFKSWQILSPLPK